VQCPDFDSNLSVGVGVDGATETSAARSDTRLCTDTQFSAARLSAMRFLCLLHDVRPVGLLHGVVPVTVEHDDRHRLHGFSG